ncbi:hypothetical protein J2S70_001319 [Trueperella bonasi]|uniref:Outer membrane protein assembly factor BamB n=1 Tax=Trueperella bonasi TaxID=312286 RepID=A0ABT9NH79_9ACTO|nr:hypothetical protein [Trueperella bonasi]MDP9806737.1 hypothetical protein [Trueperella bonasi]
MTPRSWLSVILCAIALMFAGCAGNPVNSTTTNPDRPDVAPEIPTSGFVERSNPGAWIFNEYKYANVSDFRVPDGEVLCAIQGDYAITASDVKREARGWYLPTKEVAWQRTDVLCPSDGVSPQRITPGAVLGTPRSDHYSGLLVDFATGKTLIDIPDLDPEVRVAPMPIGVAGDILVLNLHGSLYGISKSGKQMWELDAPGWTWSKNLMTGHAFGLKDQENVMVVNGITGQVVLESNVPKGRPLIQTAGGFMYQTEPEEPYTFVTLDGTVSTLDESFSGARYVPLPSAGALFPLNLYLNPDAGPIFDAAGNPAQFDIGLGEFQREGTSEMPEIVAVSADGNLTIVDDLNGLIYAVDRDGDTLWDLAALRPRVCGSYLLVELGVGNHAIVIPSFSGVQEDEPDAEQ